MHRPTSWFALVLVLTPLSAAAQVTARRADVPPRIDGVGTDPVWAEGVPTTEFWQFEPTPGAAPSQATSFQVAYDSENLYVLVQAHDTSPDGIVHALARRDSRTPSDQIMLIVDSYHDRRTGFEFGVNPDGVKRDFALYNDTDEDASWDGIWDVGTTTNADGWTAEFRIPLSQLRYPSAPTHTFGLAVIRDIERYKEKATWPRVDRDRNGFASQLGTLDGLVGLGSSRKPEFTPYLVARSETEPLAGGRFGRSEGVTIGSDVKLRITPNFTLDGTVNPDFGQVEADPAVLNLDAFETFVGERRPFFVEGTSLYRFSLNCSVVNCGPDALIYSRRIGRSPDLRGRFGDETTPSATPIAAAAKLTGRTSQGTAVGIMSALTRRVGGVDDATVEPFTNRAALSVQQDLREGYSDVRLLATAVNRSLDDWTRPYMHQSAYSAALSTRNRFGGGNYEVVGWVSASRVAGAPEVLALTQQSPVHYYQQPGDDPTVDALRTTLTGNAFQVTVGKNGKGFTRFQSSLLRRSAGYEVNDLGYLRRADVMDWSTWAALNFNTATRVYRNFSWNYNYWRHWTTSGDPIQQAVNSNAHLSLLNNWSLHGGFTWSGLGTTYCDRCTRGGPLLRQSRSFNPWFALNGDARHKIVPNFNGNMTFADDGRSFSYNVSPNLDLRFSTSLDGRIGVNFGTNDNASQWIANTTEGGATHYVFAKMHQATASTQVRLNYTALPNLTLQFYGEPFVSRGDYTDFRAVSATPGAASFDARFVPWTPTTDTALGFSFRQLRTNLVLRWEYRPGSTLFFAWAHGRSGSGGPSTQSWGDEFGDLMDLHPDNTLLIKVAHWLSW